MPDDQFQRGLIFGTEAVSAAASRDNWSAFVEFSVPLLESLELSASPGATTTTAISATPPIRRSRCAGRRSSRWRSAPRGAPGSARRRSRRSASGPSQESQFFKDTYGCIDQGIDPTSTACASLDYTIIFSGNPDLKPRIGDLQRRRRLAAERHVARLGRLLGHQAGGQDRRGALRLHLRPRLQQPGQHGLRARRRRSVATRSGRCSSSTPGSSTSASSP